jgi:hypothetical protein
MPPPLSVDEECIAVIRQYAWPISPHRRPAFYERVTELLRGEVLGPGSCARACATAQLDFIASPDAIADGRR